MIARVETAFKTCPCCGSCWATRADLLKDASIRLLGFQPGVKGHNDGLLLFNHHACGTTMAFSLHEFDGLAARPVLSPSAAALGRPAPFCVADLQKLACPPECACDYVWHLMGVIQGWSKEPADPRPALAKALQWS